MQRLSNAFRVSVASWLLFLPLRPSNTLESIPVLTPFRFPVNPNDPVCPSPRVTCDDVCCQFGYICSASFVCVKKPPPPPPGTLTVTWYTDLLGNPNIMTVHGRGFANGAAVSITEDWVTYASNGAPEYNELAVWSKNFPAVADFDLSTVMQDCSRAGSPGGGTYGEPATIRAWDWALSKYTTEIQVRTQFGGLCTANKG